MDDTQEVFLIKCPKCGQESDSIKCYKCLSLIICVYIFLYGEFEKEVCCPRCMRKKLFFSHFNYNILSGNIAWIMLLPMFIWQFCRTFIKGHSNSVLEALDVYPEYDCLTACTTISMILTATTITIVTLMAISDIDNLQPYLR